MKLINEPTSFLKIKLLRDGIEGILANMLQNIFYSLFFIVLVRHFDKVSIGYYVIGNFLYATLGSIAALGIGNSYIRNYHKTEDKRKVLADYLQLMLFSALFFMTMNDLISSLLYKQSEIHALSYIFGLQIILDNFFYVIRYHQFSTDRQTNAYRILVADALIKLICISLIFIATTSIIQLLLFTTTCRIIFFIITWKYYMKPYSILENIKSDNIDFYKIIKQIRTERKFIIISFLAILNWRIGSFFISKYFSVEDVTEYEIAFKLFSLAYMVPVVISNALYPRFVSLQMNKDLLNKLYYLSLFLLLGYGILTYTFMFCYSEQLINWLFGKMHESAVDYTKIIFLIMIPYPIIQLQASYMIAAGGELYDIWGNVLVCTLTILLGMILLQYYEQVKSVIYSLFISFIVFLGFQETILNKWKTSKILPKLSLYGFVVIIVLSFHMLLNATNRAIAFPIFWVCILLTGLIVCKTSLKTKFIYINKQI